MTTKPLAGEELHVALVRASIALQAAYDLSHEEVTISSAVGHRSECVVGSLSVRHKTACDADWLMLICADGRTHASNAAGSCAMFPDLATALEITMMSVILAASIG